MISANEDPWEISTEYKNLAAKQRLRLLTALQTNPCESPAVQSIHREPALNVDLMFGIHKEIFVALCEPITPFPSPRGSIWMWIQVPAPREGTNPQLPLDRVGSSGFEAGVNTQMSTLETSRLLTVSGLEGSEEHYGPPVKEASPCPSTALAVAQVGGDTCVFRPCHIPGVYTLLE